MSEEVAITETLKNAWRHHLSSNVNGLALLRRGYAERAEGSRIKAEAELMREEGEKV